jgi:hypothetical protein
MQWNPAQGMAEPKGNTRFSTIGEQKSELAQAAERMNY